jgi:DNA-binding MarR family transcriptional regulator
MDSLRRIVRDLRLSARVAERSAGVSGAQLFVLQALADESASSLNDLADRTATDQSSVSVVVRRLVDRKLIARRSSSDDARRVVLTLTPAGHKLLARCPEPTQARLIAALRRIGATELDALTAGLGALVREMGIAGAEPRMFFEEAPKATKPVARKSSRGAA